MASFAVIYEKIFKFYACTKKDSFYFKMDEIS